MDWSLKAMCNQTVIVEPFVSMSGSGAVTYASPVSYPCFIDEEIRLVRNALGQEVVSTAIIFVDTDVVVGVKDRITTAGGKVRPIIGIQPHYGEFSLEHYEIYL